MALGLFRVNLFQNIFALRDTSVGLRIGGSAGHLSSLDSALLAITNFEFGELQLLRVKELGI